ncbi:MAG: hypothetical protein JO147_08230 [Actinobacteria bacterium]|nr:hypothetical protein [Actinomycetota bacterium]
MFVPILLIAALAGLVAGLLLSSTGWLVASIALSVLAGVLLYLTRPNRVGATEIGGQASTVKSVDDAASDPEVWVIHGRARYHRASCAQIEGRDAEAIALDQAIGDGFLACSLCRPTEATG